MNKHVVGVDLGGTKVEDRLYGAPHTPVYEEAGLIQGLQKRLDVPLVVDNDANCLALAEFFSNTINALDLKAVILGGGVSNIPLWYKKVSSLMKQCFFGIPRKTVPIIKARLGDSASVFGGGAYLALRELGIIDFKYCGGRYESQRGFATGQTGEDS